MEMSSVGFEWIAAVEESRPHHSKCIEYGNEEDEDRKEWFYMKIGVLCQQYGEDGERKTKKKTSGVAHEYGRLRVKIVK